MVYKFRVKPKFPSLPFPLVLLAREEAMPNSDTAALVIEATIRGTHENPIPSIRLWSSLKPDAQTWANFNWVLDEASITEFDL